MFDEGSAIALADQITNYQCPSCTGPMHFDPASGKLACDYCGSSFTVEEIEALYRDRAAQAASAGENRAAAPEGSPWSEAEAAGLRAYNCPSCGAELLLDQTTTATSCPYCGNPTIVPASLSGALKPDLVIPFQVTKEQAVELLKKHYRKKPLLPRQFSMQNHLEEIQGVYAPFWLYDGQCAGSAVFRGDKVRRWTEGSYNVTETSHFACEREGSQSFSCIPVDGSTKMPDEHMDAIEPYDLSALKPFSMGYLPGYLAERFDVEAADALPRAEKRALQSLEDALRGTVEGYSGVTVKERDLHFRAENTRYALLPVWLLTTRWNGKNYLFSINGQTGKPVGDLPISKGRLAAWFLGTWAVAAAVALLLTAMTIL